MIKEQIQQLHLKRRQNAEKLAEAIWNLLVPKILLTIEAEGLECSIDRNEIYRHLKLPSEPGYFHNLIIPALVKKAQENCCQVFINPDDTIVIFWSEY